MKVLYLTKYSRNGASSRLRSYQYFPLLEKEGIQVTVSPFFDEEYLELLYAKKSISKFKIASFYLNRLKKIALIYKYDKVIIEKELFPYFFSWFEQLLYIFNIKYIVDYDDAIFHNYDLHPNKIIRFLLKNKIGNVMKYSNHVIAGNDYLASKAKLSGAKRITILPTVIDLELYDIKIENKNNKIIIGWIGSPTTYKYIENIIPYLKKIVQKYDIELQIVGAKKEPSIEEFIKFIPWKEETEVSLIANFDIGIMPLENSPWELGKCAYKIIQYMGCDIPVVASSVGMNKEVIKNGENGFLVTTEKEWIEALSQLIEDKKLRISLGQNGKITVENNYCTHAKYKILKTILKNSL
jgi:glycosyltransferase involved in cell wall biosynthesis